MSQINDANHFFGDSFFSILSKAIKLFFLLLKTQKELSISFWYLRLVVCSLFSKGIQI